MPTRFTLIRHGQTDWNVLGKWQGHAYIGLNQEGHRQAQQVAFALADTNASLIYTSDLPRARQTADYIADVVKIPVILDPRLREIDVGDWQGLTAEEVDEWDAVRLAAVRAGGYKVRRPGGESQEEVGLRMLNLLDEIQRTRTEEHILMVTHGGTIRITLMALNLLNEWHSHIENTSRTVLTFALDESRWEIESFNVTSHLTAPA
jgi:broad specificity phosphatase PhoE